MTTITTTTQTNKTNQPIDYIIYNTLRWSETRKQLKTQYLNKESRNRKTKKRSAASRWTVWFWWALSAFCVTSAFCRRSDDDERTEHPTCACSDDVYDNMKSERWKDVCVNSQRQYNIVKLLTWCISLKVANPKWRLWCHDYDECKLRLCKFWDSWGIWRIIVVFSNKIFSEFNFLIFQFFCKDFWTGLFEALPVCFGFFSQ